MRGRDLDEPCLFLRQAVIAVLSKVAPKPNPKHQLRILSNSSPNAHPTPPSPYTPIPLHPTPCTLHFTPFALDPTFYTLHPTPSLLNSKRKTDGVSVGPGEEPSRDFPLHTHHAPTPPYHLPPTSRTLHLTPHTLPPCTLHPTPYTQNPTPKILHPTP